MNTSLSSSNGSVKPAPEEILQLMFCTCPRKCLPDSCPCVDNGLLCTDACTKQDCENYDYPDSDDDDIEIDFSSFFQRDSVFSLLKLRMCSFLTP